MWYKQKATEQILELQKQIDANPLNSQMVIEVQKQQQKIADENSLDLTSIITVNSYTSKAEEDAQGLKKSVDSMTMKPKIDITSEVANARSQIVNLVNGTYTAKIGLEVQGTSIITKVKNVIQTAVSKTSESGNSSWTGSAFANGSWRVGHSGKALVGELGAEILVSDGKYRVIGENGDEFVNTKPNDIIFNHIQTSEILKNGHIDSRGRALMSGSAYVTGKGSNVSSSGSGKIPSSNNSREIQLPHISPHILRHTAATRLAESGCDIKVMQYLLGHTDIRTTMRVYNHVDAERVKREIEKLKQLQVKMG